MPTHICICIGRFDMPKYVRNKKADVQDVDLKVMSAIKKFIFIFTFKSLSIDFQIIQWFTDDDLNKLSILISIDDKTHNQFKVFFFVCNFSESEK